MIGIYKITSPTNKVYIGQSVDIDFRFKSYNSKECKSQIKLNRSFLKYGIDNHIFEVVENCNTDSLNEKERYYQEKYNCVDNGLNCRFTTTKDKSGYFSKESKEKMSLAAKNKVITKEHRAKLTASNSRSMLGKKHSAESLALMSENRKGKASRKGAVLSDETKNKIALKATGRKASEETKLKMSITRQAMALANKLNYLK